MRRIAVFCATLLAVAPSLASVQDRPTEVRVLSRWADDPARPEGRRLDWSALPAQYRAPGLSVAAVNDNAYLYVRLVSSGNADAEMPAETELAATVLPPDPESPESDEWLPEDLPLLEPPDVPFGEEFDAEELGSLLDLLGLEEWALAGMNTTEWLPELGMRPPEPQGVLQTSSREGSNSVYLLRIPLAESVRSGSESTGGRTGSLVLEFAQKVPGRRVVQSALWDDALRPEKREAGGNSWEAGEPGPPDAIRSNPGSQPAWLRLTVQLAETPDASPGAP